MSRTPRFPRLSRPRSRLSPITLALRCALCGLAASGAGLTGTALAQDTSQVAPGGTRLDDPTPRDYRIPAGPLGASLGAFASRSDCSCRSIPN